MRLSVGAEPGAASSSDASDDHPLPDILNRTLLELKEQIGTYTSIETVTPESKIIEALTKFVNRPVSALPVVDSSGKVVDIYAKFDVINLAAEKTYNNLDFTIQQALVHRNEWFEGVQKCTLNDTLGSVLNTIVKAEVHRLVVTDDAGRVQGVISLSDIFSFLVLKPAGALLYGLEDVMETLSTTSSPTPDSARNSNDPTPVASPPDS